MIEKFGEKIMSHEADGIFQWALVGLRRLMDNEWKITWSNRSREFMQGIKIKTLNFPDFIKETLTEGEGDVTSKELYQVYRRWCNENGLFAVSSTTFSQWFNDHACHYSFRRSNHIIRNRKCVRGYKQLSIKPEWNTVGVILK